MVKRRVRHTSSAVGRPAGTGRSLKPELLWLPARGRDGREGRGERRDRGRGVEKERQGER